jgi:hypothetical protein
VGRSTTCPTRLARSGVAVVARNLLMDLRDRADRRQFLIRNRDSKFIGSFDAVVAGADMRIIRTPIRAPRANAIAERFIGTPATGMPRPPPDHRTMPSRRRAACMCSISTRTDLTDHSITAQARAAPRHVPARPSSHYDTTGSAASPRIRPDSRPTGYRCRSRDEISVYRAADEGVRAIARRLIDRRRR